MSPLQKEACIPYNNKDHNIVKLLQKKRRELSKMKKEIIMTLLGTSFLRQIT